MKPAIFIGLIHMLAFFQAFGQNNDLKTNPTAYNNFIVNEQDNLIEKIIEYNIVAAYTDNFELNNSRREEISKQLQASIEKLKALHSFKNDSKLRDEALSVFALYKEAYDIEFSEVNLLRKERESSFEAMEKYFKAQDKAENKLKTAGDKFVKAQQNFAKKYSLNLKPSHSQDVLLDIANVNKYSRSVFLEYFRVSKSDANFLDAVNQQKMDEVDVKLKQILEATETSGTNLKNVHPYKNDSTFKVKAIELINFHKKLANEEYSELATIIKNPNRTQKDVNRFNEIVISVNDKCQILLSEFNRENKEMLKRNIHID